MRFIIGTKDPSMQSERVRKKLIFENLFILLLFFTQISLYAQNVNITVNQTSVLYTDFDGYGAQYDPFFFMEENQEEAYTNPFNEAYWELQKLRVKRMGLNVVRMWYQPEWAMTGWDSYDWNTRRMNSVYKFLNAAQDAGIDVLFNFGWLLSTYAQSWYAMDIPNKNKSAPNDLDAFARACSNTLNHLRNTKGYTCIKYLTFYNESNAHWCFEGPADQREYYKDMVVKAHNQLVADGRRDWVEIVSETSTAGTNPWAEYFNNVAPQAFDYHTLHRYNAQDLGEKITNLRPTISGLPIGINEYGKQDEPYRNTYEYGLWWTKGFIDGANKGPRYIMQWRLCDQYLLDPHTSNGTGQDSRYYGLHKWGIWEWLPDELKPRLHYYASSLLSRYIEKDSEVIYSSSSNGDVKVLAVKNGSDYTIVVLNENAGSQSVGFNFNGSISKTFRKHAYTSGVAKESNALIPAQEASFSATSSFTDNNVAGNSMALYTTYANELQVEVTPAKVEIALNQTIDFSHQIIDGSGDVTWSVVSGGGSINSSGLYTAPGTSGFAAIKATSTSDVSKYGIAVVEIVGVEINLA